MSTYGYNNFNSPGPGPQPPRNSDPYETISWIIDIGLIFLWFPVGLALTIANALGHNLVGRLLRRLFGQPSQTAKRTPPGYQRPTAQQRTPVNEQRQAAGTAQESAGVGPAPKAEQLVRRPDEGAKVKEVFGWILTAFGLFMAVGALIGADGIWTILTGIAMAIGGGLLVFSGREGKKKEAAFRRCLTVTGTKGIVKLKPLAKTLGMTETELEKQLSEMLDRGYYGRRAYIDHARELLVIEPEQMRDVYRAEDEARAQEAQQQASAQPTSQSEFDQIIERIRQADIDIEDEGMSAKIRQMQAITEAIFKEVEAHPEKRPQIERFMSYYLPTTLKLLEAYARIEAQGVSGENTAKAKADIERIADTLVEGYRKQLDTLYRAEAVDIAGDVSVIESMMRRDGLTGQSDFRPFEQFAAGTAGSGSGAAAGAAAAEAPAPAEDTETAGQTMGGT